MTEYTLKVVGTGGGVYSTLATRAMSCLVLERKNGQKYDNVVFDVGLGSLVRAAKMGIDFCQVNTVVISHLHLDHWWELLPMVNKRYRLAKKNHLELETLRIFGPKGIKKMFWNGLCMVGDNDFDPDVEFIEGAQVRDDMNMVRVSHYKGMRSLAAVLNDGEKRIIYTGDMKGTRLNRKKLEVFTDSDLLMAEASGDIPGHQSVKQALMLSRKSRAKRTLLIHWRSDHLQDILKVCQRYDNCILATDELEVPI